MQNTKISLDAFSKKYDLINHAVETCKKSIENYLKENAQEGFPLKEIELRSEHQAFIFNHHYFKEPYVKTQIGLYKLEKGIAPMDAERIGYYILCTDEKGNHFDDSLVYER